MAKAERKLVGMSTDLHGELARLSEVERLPMTTLIQAMLDRASEIDWEPIRVDYKRNRLTWPNMRRRIEEYQAANPDISDVELQALTGFSIVQVETITYTAHKRALAALIKSPHLSSADLAKASKTSLTFAKRIWDQAHGEKKVTKSEEFLWDTTQTPPVPRLL